MVAALAQHQSGTNFATTVVATFSPATTTGRLLTLCVQTQQATDCTGVADSAGNTWVKATSIEVTTQKHIEIWYCPNANSCTTVTATAGATAVNANMSIQEWSGSTSFTLRNSSALSNASGTNPTACTATCTVGDVILSGVTYLEAVSGTRQDTLTDGTALDALARGTTAFNSAYKITSLGTADGCAWTMSPTVSSAVATASFGVTGGGGGGGGGTAVPAFVATASNNGNGTAPTVTVPATCATNNVILVILSQNNSDVVTGAPGGLTSLNDSTVSAFNVKLYRGLVGTGGVTAGGTLTWALSAIRAWSITLVAYSNVDTTTPILGSVAVGATITSTCTTPSLTTSAAATIIEAGMGKSNPGPITTWTAPTGYTSRGQVAAFQTFAAAGFFGERSTNTSPAGTYGTDTWTADQPFDTCVRYTFALNPAAGSGSGGPTFRLGAASNGSGNSVTPSIIIPSACQNGDLVLIHLSMNNTNTVTGTPSNITTLNTDTTLTTFPNIMYWAIIGGAGPAPGDTLTWALSAIRAWELSLVAYSGASTSAPTFAESEITSTVTTITAPSFTTTATGLVIEAGSGKSGATAITNWTAPTGYTIRAQSDAYQGFSGSSFFAEKNGGTTAAGAYGGDVYTADQSLDAAVRYTISVVASGSTPLPTANAGADQDVEPWSLVTLDASASALQGGTRTWSQLSGTTVTLSSTSAVNPTFTAPAALALVTLVFQLSITGPGGTNTDSVNINVLPATQAYANAGVWKPMQFLRASGGAWA